MNFQFNAMPIFSYMNNYFANLDSIVNYNSMKYSAWTMANNYPQYQNTKIDYNTAIDFSKYWNTSQSALTYANPYGLSLSTFTPFIPDVKTITFDNTQTSLQSEDKKVQTKKDTDLNLNVNHSMSDEFINGVKKIADKINCDYNAILAVMKAESGLNPRAVNKNSGATGLIQFMPSTAKGLGTSVEELKKMSAIDQLKYVEKFLVNAKRSAGFSANEKLTPGEVYALVFMPAKAKSGVLAVDGTKAYSANKGTDVNKDGRITTDDLSKRLQRFA